MISLIQAPAHDTLLDAMIDDGVDYINAHSAYVNNTILGLIALFSMMLLSRLFYQYDI